MKMKSYHHNLKRNQQGAALLVSMMFLLVLTLLGIHVFRSSIMQLQMADNAGSRMIAFQQAETARAYAESILNAKADDMSTGTAFSCATDGFFSRATPAIAGCSALDADSMEWDDDDSFTVPGATDQRYVIEYLGIDQVLEPNAGVEVGMGESDMIDVYVFQILAKGEEAAGGSSVLQSIFIARKSS